MLSLIVLCLVAAGLAVAGANGRAKTLNLTPEQAPDVPAGQFDAWRAARSGAYLTLTLLPIFFFVFTVALGVLTKFNMDLGDSVFLGVLAAVVFRSQSRKADRLKQA